MDAPADIADLEPGEFGRRRRRAQQLGTSAWLWPEVSAVAWAEALADIRQAITRILGGGEGRLSSIDRRAVSVACYTAGVGPLLGWWLEAGQLSAGPEIRDLLALHLEHARARERRVRAQMTRIVSAFAERQIRVTVLKGGDTAYRYFPAPEARPASDFDVLVPSDLIRVAEAALADEGLVRVGSGARDTTWADPRNGCEPKSLWLVHADDPWSVDLHSSLDFSASAGAATIRLDRAEPFAASEPWPIGPFARVLPQPLLLLHLAAHASGGLQNLTFLRMVEIVLVIRRDLTNGRLSWSEFIAVATMTGGLGAAYPALAMCNMLAPGTIPDDVVERCGEMMPARARAVVGKLEPDTVQRVDRVSVAEHFMWVSGPGGWVRQLWSDLLPSSGSLRRIWSVYATRFYRVLRGRFTR